MLLAIDASRAAGEQKTGVGWYCYHLLQHLKDVVPHDVRVVLYSDQPLPEELSPWPRNWTERVLTRRGPMWSQFVLAYAVLRDRPDVLFIPAHVIPILTAYASRLTPHVPRLITTIHDVVFKEFPETYAPRERWYADHATRIAVRHADRIIVPTEAVKRDLITHYRADNNRISVIHHGVILPVISAPEAHPPLAETLQNVAKKSHKIVQRCQDVRSLAAARDDDGGRIVLYVGRLERKKNVVRMVEAFTDISPRHPNARFVLAGSPGYGYEDIRAAIARSRVGDRIATPGWVDRGTYDRLLASASVFLFPTLGEGFGLPIIEAMAAGVPVITSTGGAHEEVSGDAALLVPATDTSAIADALDRLLTDRALRNGFVERGKQRAGAFRWEQSAIRTWEVIKSVLSA